ncbi:MAG TPA: lysyl oxidase family protein [Gemmatimonadales bacterium]|nr:lysyl oxidase family protein [Gemmatimonadales bacterium]
MQKIVALSLLSALAACDTTQPREPTAPGGPLFAHEPTPGVPDIIVDQPTLAQSWVIYDETLSPTACDVIEGDVPAGDHRTLRITVNTPNIGTGDLSVGDPNIHADPNGDGDLSDSDGLFELATCHHHYHFRHYATYELFPINEDGSLGSVILSAKRGFCMIDVAPYNTPGGLQPTSWVYRSCGRIGVPGNQGISIGWADQYYKWLQGQYFVIDPETVPPGPYLIRIHVNPPFTAGNHEPCPVQDSDGFCHQFQESDYGNNVAEIRITIPDRTGKTGYGPGGGQNLPASVNSIDDEKRPSK